MAAKRATVYGDGRIFKHKKSRFWYVAYSIRGNQVRKSTGLVYDKENPESNLNERKAREVLREHMARARETTGRAGTGRVKYDDLRELILRDYRTTGKRSLQSLEQSRLYNLDKFFLGRAVERITDSVVDTYIDQRMKQGAAHSTRNNELAALKRMFRLGVDKKLIGPGAVPKITITPALNARKVFVEPREFERLKAALPDYLVGLVSWLYATSWRVSEGRDLKWEGIDDARKMATIKLTKNDDGKKFPFGRDALATEAIERACEIQDKDCPFVFHRKGKRIGSFRKAWATARKAASEKTPKDDAIGVASAAKLATLIVHDMRRSATRNLIDAGVSEHVAMKITGHRTTSTFRRYDIRGDKDIEDAIDLLNLSASRVAASLGGKKGETAERTEGRDS